MRSLIFFGVWVVLGSALVAQNNNAASPTLSPEAAYEHYNSPEYLAAVATNHLIQELGLTGDQREKVYCAKLNYLQHKSALIKKHEREGGSSMAARLQLYEYRKTCNREIRSALNPTQIEKFDAYLNRMENGNSGN